MTSVALSIERTKDRAMKLIEAASLEDAGARVAGLIVARLSDAIDSRRPASLVVTGGTSPRPVYTRLARAALDWARVTITLSDDRWVPADHPDSNERLLRETLLTGPVGAAARFVGLVNDAPTPEAGLDETERRLASLPRPFDAVYLGMGDDGHVASLFPGRPELRETARRCVAGLAPAEPRQRISLAAPLLLNARQIVLMITRAKRPVLERALEPGPADAYPARLLLHQDRVPVVVVIG